MKRKPLIVNTARGGLVDEQAMVDALKAGQIGGFAFDVLTTEPPAADNPLMSVIDRPDVIITPHMAFTEQQVKQEHSEGP